MHKRQKTIYQELLKFQDQFPLTSTHLAKITNVSDKTVRADIKEIHSFINDYGAEILSIRGQGYSLKINDYEKLQQLVEYLNEENANNTGVILSPQERIDFLLQELLLTDRYQKLEEIADKIFVSRATLQNDLRVTKEILLPYGIHVKVKPGYGIKLEGNETQLRYFISEHVFTYQRQENKMHTESLLEEVDTLKLQDILISYIQKNQITISDIELQNLTIHLAIAIQRIKKDQYITLYSNDIEEITSQAEYDKAKNIVQFIEIEFQISFPDIEIAYVAIHLLGTKLSENTDKRQTAELFINEEIRKVTKQMIEAAERKFDLNISNDRSLHTALALHVKPAINRHRYSMNIRNPMLEAIKANYPIAFEAAIESGRVLKEIYKFSSIDENEIGYIALHIGAALERQEAQQKPIRCIIVCASGAGSAQLLYYKLKKIFGSRIDVVDITEYYRLRGMSFEDIDYIITTVRIDFPVSVPVHYVHTILDEDDTRKLKAHLFHHTSNSLQWIEDNLTFLRKPFKNKNEVLTFMSKKLQDEQLVPIDFLDSVKERENISATSFGNFIAVPHPMKPMTNKTFWTICTLEHPIDWNGKPVQFICLLNIASQNQDNLQSMYKLLVDLAEQKNIVQELIKTSSIDEFKRIFSNIVTDNA